VYLFGPTVLLPFCPCAATHETSVTLFAYCLSVGSPFWQVLPRFATSGAICLTTYYPRKRRSRCRCPPPTHSGLVALCPLPSALALSLAAGLVQKTNHYEDGN
jgi:hypothetical protein